MKAFPTRLTATALAASLALGLAACGSSLPPEEPVQVPTEPPVAVQNTVISGAIVDSTTGAALTGTAATVAIGGAGAANVVNLAGTAITSVSSTDGTFSFAIKAGVTPSAASPINLTLSVTRSGNIAVTVPVSVTATGTTNVEVKMLPLQTTAGAVQGLPAATATGTATVATATTAGSLPVTSGAGTSSAAFVATTTFTPPASDTNAKPVTATAAVPPTVTAGRVVNGTLVPAATGTVAAQVIAGNPTQPTAVDVLPPVAPVPAAANAADTTLPTLSGFAKINIVDSAGNPVNRFSAPITVTMDLQSDAVNPDTNQPYAVGQTIGIATFNEVTATWEPKKLANGTQITGTVVSIDAATGNRKVEFQTDNLSWFSFFWFRPFCATGFNLVPASGDTRSADVRFWIYNSAARFFSYYVQRYSLAASQNFSFFMPRGSTVSAVIVDRTTGQVITTAGAGGCTTSTINIPAPIAAPGSVTVTTREQCPDGSNNRALPATVTITSSNGRVLGSAYTGATGSATLSGIPAGAANISASYTAASGTQTLTGSATVVSAQTATVPLLRTLTCNTGTGGTGGTGGG